MDIEDRIEKHLKRQMASKCCFTTGMFFSGSGCAGRFIFFGCLMLFDCVAKGAIAESSAGADREQSYRHVSIMSFPTLEPLVDWTTRNYHSAVPLKMHGLLDL